MPVERQADTDDRIPDAPAPSDAFQALGNETRMTILRTLAQAEPQAFSDLFEATDEDASAGFAYHLRQLADRFVRQRPDETYELTDAGREVVRAVQAGTYTESVERDGITLEDACPFCGETALVASVADNVTEISCEHCERPVLGLSFPPSGYTDRSDDELPQALDAHHRRRIESFGDGVCPDCAGAVNASIEAVEAVDTTNSDGAADAAHTVDSAKAAEAVDKGTESPERTDEYVAVQAAFECETCGATLRCPVSLTVLDHAAVVAFYHDHGVDVRDRPLWNVGSEWRERVVSRDPWCVLVTTRYDGEELLLYVAGDGTVVDDRWVGPDDDEPAEQVAAADVTDASVQRGDSDPGERLESNDEATA